MRKIKCELCQKTFISTSGYEKRCGDIKDKSSCKYKGYRKISNERCYKWRKQHPEKWRKQQLDRYYRIRNTPKYKEQRRKRENASRLRLRFKVFQRDNFTCRYCGRKAPEVILEIDHKYPKSKGGKDKIENYITACKECNLGKGDVVLNEFNKV